MPEIHLRQPQFTYSACGPFTKHEQRIQKFKETDDTNYIYKNELDKACFVHDAAYSDSKDLTKRTIYIMVILKNGCETIILLCIQHIMKENLFLLKDLLER